MSGLRKLLGGIGVGESPRWHDGLLWYCDWTRHEVVAADTFGMTDLIAWGPSYPFCIDFLPDGCLVIVSGKEGRLLRQNQDGELETYADLSSFPEAHWNDIVVDGRGNTYVNDVGFDLLATSTMQPGTIAVVTPEGVTKQVASGLAFPNGMAVTPDNSTLIVAESYARQLTAFGIDDDGTLSEPRVWADLGSGTPDGICIDAEGAVWYADVPNQRCVRVQEGGEVLQTVDTDRACFACMLGGPEGSTLFMVTARWLGPEKMFDGPLTGQVLTSPAPAPHAGWP